ncbi:hypothetical protein P691DRAFT_766759 [Macrolepiota fuliginosa MF-IS2]|uniref:Uncharacterized protein n=1 Tax=Macrolepiota fuliginosa MF-IS2 TaxID=1400762 RepID=A0A9P6BWV4_9AGAR|nr:hypothetical protein P691DRAFT_766759 [Macrolepiota fuliginosa MF-IS2]
MHHGWANQLAFIANISCTCLKLHTCTIHSISTAAALTTSNATATSAAVPTDTNTTSVPTNPAGTDVTIVYIQG